MRETTEQERALMRRTLELCEMVDAFLRDRVGATPAQIDLVGVALVASAARREITPEARMWELQALVRDWVRAGP